MTKRYLWHGLILLLSIAFLWGSEQVYRQVEAWQPVSNTTDNTILFADGFSSDGSEQNNPQWQTYEGRLSAQISEDTLAIRINAINETAYSANNILFKDFDLRVRASAIDGPVDNGYGVIFRLQEPISRCDMPLLALCGLAEIDVVNIGLRLLFRPQDAMAQGYYMFLISSDGYYSVWRAETNMDGTRAQMVSTWIPSDAIQQGLGVINDIRVMGEGNLFKFFINDTPVPLCIPNDAGNESTYFMGECVDGQLVDTWQDDTFSQGKIGVVGQSTATGGAGVIISFPQVIVINPAKATRNNQQG